MFVDAGWYGRESCASVTVLPIETWYLVDLTADVWTHSDSTCA